MVFFFVNVHCRKRRILCLNILLSNILRVNISAKCKFHWKYFSLKIEGENFSLFLVGFCGDLSSLQNINRKITFYLISEVKF